MQASLAKLDSLLQNSDSDSAAWADGGGIEEAEKLLASLTHHEQAQLEALVTLREARWRACLAMAVHPRQGEFAERLLLGLAWDRDASVAWTSVSSIAFYCGVNDSAQGPFVDAEIRNSAFLSIAKSTSGLADQVLKVSAGCHPQFQRRLALLVKILKESA